MYKARLDKLAAWLKPPGVSWEEYNQAARRMSVRIEASVRRILEGVELAAEPDAQTAADWETMQRWVRQRGGPWPAETAADAADVRRRLGLAPNWQ